MKKYAVITEPHIEISKASLNAAKKERPYDSFTNQLIAAHCMNGMRNGATTIVGEYSTLDEARNALKAFRCSYSETSAFANTSFFSVSLTYIEEYSYDEEYEEWNEEGEYDFAAFFESEEDI